MNRYWKKSFAVVCLLAALPASTQNSGSISGTVLDPSGAAIVGATVSLVEKETGRDGTGQTDSAGHYEFSRCRAGVIASKSPPQASEALKNRTLNSWPISRFTWMQNLWSAR